MSGRTGESHYMGQCRHSFPNHPWVALQCRQMSIKTSPFTCLSFRLTGSIKTSNRWTLARAMTVWFPSQRPIMRKAAFPCDVVSMIWTGKVFTSGSLCISSRNTLSLLLSLSSTLYPNLWRKCFKIWYPLIARFMGPTWGPSGADRLVPCWPHELCYLGLPRAFSC